MYPPEGILSGILVNTRGQRFVPEDGYYGLIGHEVAFKQDGKAWMIADQAHAYGWKDFRLNVAAEAATVSDLEQKLGLPAKPWCRRWITTTATHTTGRIRCCTNPANILCRCGSLHSRRTT